MTYHLFEELRDQIEKARQLSVGPDEPKQIRVTDLIPEGMMFVTPCNEDGTAVNMLTSGRTLEDGGPHEVLIHPADLKRMMDYVWEEHVKYFHEEQGKTPEEIKQEQRRTYLRPDKALLGIPIIDDTVRARYFKP